MRDARAIEIGERLARAIRMAGLTSYQLAHLAALPVQTITEYVHGHSLLAEQPHGLTFAAVLDVSLRWLLTGEVSPSAKRTIERFQRFAGRHLFTTDEEKIVELLEMMASGDELPPRPIAINEPVIAAEAACDESGEM